MIGGFLIGLCVVSAAAALQYECPEPEDIYPCYCEEEEGEPILMCNHFTTPQQMHTSFKGLKGHKIAKLSFYKNWILDPINSDAFKDVVAEKIIFENSTITLSPPQFQGLNNHLKSIQMRACFNKTNPIGTWSLAHLTHLKELILDKNKILTLPKSWIESAPDSLITLNMENNDMITLEDEVFSRVKNLVFMVLDSNRLTAIRRNMFPNPAQQLRSLSLNFNRLRYLPYDLFEDMPNLRIVEMTNNRLTVLESDVWKSTFLQLTKLDFTDNPFQCDSAMKWMVESASKPVLFYGECSTPEHLRGKSIKRLRPNDL